VFKTGQHLVGNVDNRVLWLELLRAISECLPRPDPPEKRPKDSDNWKELHIQSLECQKVEDLATWYQGVKDKPPLNKNAPAADPSAGAVAAGAGTDGTGPDLGPTGPGWVVQLTGYHYHNPLATEGGAAGGQYVLDTLIAGLEGNAIPLPSTEKKTIAGDKEKKEEQAYVPMKDLGISYPVLIDCPKPVEERIPDPNADQSEAAKTGEPGALAPETPEVPDEAMTGAPLNARKEVKTILARRANFVVQFCWKPKPPTARLEDKKEEGPIGAE